MNANNVINFPTTAYQDHEPEPADEDEPQPTDGDGGDTIHIRITFDLGDDDHEQVVEEKQPSRVGPFLYGMLLGWWLGG